MGKRGIKPVDLDVLLFWESRWWFAFRQLRDGFFFDIAPPDQKAKRKWQRDKLRATERINAEQFLSGEERFYKEAAEWRPQTILEALNRYPMPPRLPGELPWLDSEAEAETERLYRVALLRDRLKRKRIASRRQIWRDLITARNEASVERACRRWARLADLREQWNRIREVELKATPEQVAQNAKAFLWITNDVRFPKGDDERAVKSQLDYLARGMAGVSAGRSPATGINRLRRLHPKRGDASKRCGCWRCRRQLMTGEP